jgi:hypothetical protein
MLDDGIPIPSSFVGVCCGLLLCFLNIAVLCRVFIPKFLVEWVLLLVSCSGVSSPFWWAILAFRTLDSRIYVINLVHINHRTFVRELKTMYPLSALEAAMPISRFVLRDGWL